MSSLSTASGPPEYNVTAQDYSNRRHFRYTGPTLIDIHAHVTRTKPVPDVMPAPGVAERPRVAEPSGVAGAESSMPRQITEDGSDRADASGGRGSSRAADAGSAGYAGLPASPSRTKPRPPIADLGVQPDSPPNLDQADIIFSVAHDFHVGRILSMCPPEDIPPLRERFGERIRFNGSISKKLDEPEDVAYRLLGCYLELGIRAIKFWAAPRGRERGLFVDAPWRIEAVRRARAAGIRLFMVHVADPDVWFRTAYADSAKFGTKADQYVGLERLLQMFPDVNWIAAHMGGDPEHADHLQALLERYPHLHFDTSATKWQVREVSAHKGAIRALILRFPDRFLFGSDLVTHPGLAREHYVSRYWCQRTLWESAWEGRSPIADGDFTHAENEPATPMLRSLALPHDVLLQIYHANAMRLLGE